MKISGEDKSIPVWVILICLATLIFGIAGHALWTADEPREAEIAREMSEVIEGCFSGGDADVRTTWAIPYLVGKPFVEKPPLYYWLSALLMLSAGKLIGTAVAARALSALAAALTLVVVWSTVRDYLGKPRAAMAVVILATMVGFFQAAHWVLIDPFLMLLVTSSVLFLFRGFNRDRSGLLLMGYLSAGLAFLTKGFAAWGVLFIPWLFLLIQFRRHPIRRPILHLVGLLLLIGPGLIWTIAFYGQGGDELWNEWFVNNNIGRFTGNVDYGHIRGPFYYFGLAAGMLLPWTVLLVGSLFRRREKDKRERSVSERGLFKVSIAWAIGGFIILSLAGTKRDIYLYPLLPGFAVLCVFGMHRISGWVHLIYRFLCPILLLPAILLAFISPIIIPGEFSIVFAFKPSVLICAIIGVFALVRLKRNLIARIATISSALYLTVIFAVFPIIDTEKNYEPATRRIAAVIPDARRSRVCGWHTDETTRAIFSYYTGLTVTELRDKLHPEKNLGRLANILNGKDSEYDSVIVLLKRKQKFPPEGMLPASYQVVAEERMGRNRRLLLLTGAGK